MERMEVERVLKVSICGGEEAVARIAEGTERELDG